MKTKPKRRVVWIACSETRNSDIAWPSRKWLIESELLKDLRTETGQKYEAVRFVEARRRKK